MTRPLAFVVDDDKHLGQAFCSALELSGFQAEYIGDSKQALSLIREKLPLLIILDVQMPSVSGLEILRTLRDDEKIRDIKVILATANNYILQQDHASELADLVLSKPLSVSQIMDFARRMIDSTAQDNEPTD